ncbi:hypothetical protein CLU79DRAFT_664281, partial [Phycomyces nitens]
YQGPIDRRVLTSRPPMEVLLDLIRLLTALGIDVKNDVGYKLQCSRRANRALLVSPSGSDVADDAEKRDSATFGLSQAEPIYGDPSIDRGDQVLFELEICQCSDMRLYILDCHSLSGSEGAYRFVMQKLL